MIVIINARNERTLAPQGKFFWAVIVFLLASLPLIAQYFFRGSGQFSFVSPYYYMTTKSITWGAAVQAVAEETRGHSPALKIKRAAIAAHQLSQAIEALEESLDAAAWLSEETKADVIDLAETFKAVGHDGEHLAERFGHE